LPATVKPEIGKALLLSRQRAWIQAVNGTNCTSMDENGAIIKTDNECGDFQPVICAATIKESIIGSSNYTSYFTDQEFLDYREFFARLVDAKRLPIQLGGTLTVTQQDIYDEFGVEVTHTVSDEFPSALTVRLILQAGSPADVQVTLEHFDDPSTVEPHEWSFTEDSVMPSKMQVHVTGMSPVCLKQVDLLIRNETGSDHVATSIPASLFAACLDFNVCTASDERLCARSLMYYDPVLECAVLRTDDPKYPRDFAIDFFKDGCARLTSWNHPTGNGEPFKFELLDDLAATEAIQVTETNSYDAIHNYLFEPTAPRVVNLDDTEVLPVNFIVTGGEGGIVNDIRITRYGQIISQVDFASLWDCINVCSAVADPTGLRLGTTLTKEAYLDLINAINCRKLEFLLSEDDKTGREMCTSPPLNVSSLEEIKAELTALLPSSEPYRTLFVEVELESLDEIIGDLVTITTNRGLMIEIAPSATDGFFMNSTLFKVEFLGELYFDGLDFNGTTSVEVLAEGLAELAGCSVSLPSASTAFLTNTGTTTFRSVQLYENTVLQNEDDGFLSLSYVDFYDQSSVESLGGTVQVSRLTLYEDFENPLLIVGSDFPDSFRLYDVLDEETDPRCQGSDNGNSTLSLDSTECQDVCEDEFECSGYLAYFISDGDRFSNDDKPQCDLCLGDIECAFNCSDPSSQYLKPISNFDYAKLEACPVLETTFETLDAASLEECKMLCDYYRVCEGFRLVSSKDIFDPSFVRTSCELIKDLDFDDSCDEANKSTFYIPFVDSDSQSFVNVNGTLVGATEITTHPELAFDECAAVW
jgi:hypothetical protein